MLNLIKSIAIQDQSVASNIAHLDNIMSGVDGASTFGYSLAPVSLQVNDNQKQQYLHEHAIDIRVIRGTDTGVLDAISGNNRQVKVTGVTPDGVVVWNQPVYFAQTEQYDNRIVSRQIRLTQTSTIGYVDGQTPIYAGGNALALYDILNRKGNEFGDFIAYVEADGGTIYADRSSVADDIGTSGAQASLIVPCGEGKSGSLYYYTDNETTINGFSLTSGVTGSVSGSVQYLTFVSGTGRWQSESFLYPFEGQQVTFSLDILTSSGGGSGEMVMAIEYLDSSSTAISTSTQATDDQSAGARVSITGTTPSGTTYIRVYVDFSNSTSGDLWTVTKPRLTSGNANQWTI